MSEAPIFGAAAPDGATAASVAAAAVPGATTVLDGLRADFAVAQAGEDVCHLTVPKRDGYEVRFRTDLEYTEMIGWQKAATDPMMPLGVNALLLAQLALSQCCLAILKDGEEIVDREGKPVTFASPELHTLLGVPDTLEAVRVFYKKDGYVTGVKDKLFAESGYGPERVPTRR